MSTVSPEDWSALWRNNIVTSFGTTMFADNYDKEALEFWRQQLVGDYEHVVDLACGNGALVWIANDLLNGDDSELRITGVDAADIDPFTILGKAPGSYPGVEFIANTPIEALPFEDESIDVIISQYGIEYSDLNQTIVEAQRVLKRSGKLCAILHSESSVVLEGAKVGVECGPVLDNYELDKRFLDLAVYLGSRSDSSVLIDSTEVENLCDQINSILGAIRSVSQTYSLRSKNTLKDYVKTTVGTFYPEEPPKKAASFFDILDGSSNVAEADLLTNGKSFSVLNVRENPDREQEIRTAATALLNTVRRLENLASAALSEMALLALREDLDVLGFEVTLYEKLMYEGKGEMGVKLVAIKR
ncbi:MAG: class I SAM-dependent methyltransferase [Halioglobus sp.]